MNQIDPVQLTWVQLTQERGSDYGAPEDNHSATSDFMAVWLRRKYGPTLIKSLDAEDTVAFNILQKLSRQANSPKSDNWHDIQGYAQNALDMPSHGRHAPKAPPGYVSPIVTDNDDLARGVLHVRAAQEDFEAEDFVDIVFDGGRFIKVENMQRASVRFGEWIERDDGYWVLRVPRALPGAPIKSHALAPPQGDGDLGDVR